MPPLETPTEKVPDSFLRRQQQLRHEQELRAQEEQRLDVQHAQMLDSLIRPLEAFRGLGPRDGEGNPMWVGVQRVDNRHTVIHCFFADRFRPERWLLVFTVTALDNLISFTDRIHEEPADAEDAESLLDVLFQRIADYTAQFLPYPPEIDQDSDKQPEEDLVQPSASESLQEEDTELSEGEDPGESTESGLDDEEGFTLALVKVRMLRETTANQLEEQLQDYLGDRPFLSGHAVLPAEESFFDVDPQNPDTPRWYFKLLLALEGELSAEQVDAELMTGVMQETLPLEEIIVQDLAYRKSPLFLIEDTVEDTARRIREGS